MPSHDHQHQSQPSRTSSELPFIPPQLDYSTSGSTSIKQLYIKRFIIIACAVLLVFGIGAAIFALTRGGSDNTPAAVQQEPEETDEQEHYEGDGSDITQTKEPVASWVCPEGAVKESGDGAAKKCTIESVKTATIKTDTSCPAGYTRIDGNSGVACQRVIGGRTETVGAKTSYSCPSGYTRSGTKCSRTVTKAATTTYSCPSGYLLLGTKCTKSTTTEGKVKAACASGFKKSGSGVNTTCTKTQKPKANGKCPANFKKSGSGKNAKCTRTKAPTLSCATGYAKSGSGKKTKCTKITVTTVNATAKKICPSGYTLSGSTCRRTVSSAASVKYSCAAGYNRSGSKCLRYIGGTVQSAAPITKKTCPSGYKRAGSSSVCEKRQEKVEPAEQIYECEEGWELLESVDTGMLCVFVEQNV